MQGRMSGPFENELSQLYWDQGQEDEARLAALQAPEAAMPLQTPAPNFFQAMGAVFGGQEQVNQFQQMAQQQMAQNLAYQQRAQEQNERRMERFKAEKSALRDRMEAKQQTALETSLKTRMRRKESEEDFNRRIQLIDAEAKARSRYNQDAQKLSPAAQREREVFMAGIDALQAGTNEQGQPATAEYLAKMADRLRQQLALSLLPAEMIQALDDAVVAHAPASGEEPAKGEDLVKQFPDLAKTAPVGQAIDTPEAKAAAEAAIEGVLELGNFEKYLGLADTGEAVLRPSSDVEMGVQLGPKDMQMRLPDLVTRQTPVSRRSMAEGKLSRLRSTVENVIERTQGKPVSVRKPTKLAIAKTVKDMQRYMAPSEIRQALGENNWQWLVSRDWLQDVLMADGVTQ